MSVTIADIEAARRVIAGAVLRTPMLPAPRLSALTGAEVYVKYENLQVTNSFKDRGALNKLASLSEAERARGVIAMSAGNHAQAVAYHAARLGIPATIVMPVTTPFVKVAATRSHGAEVVLRRRERGGGAGARAKQLRSASAGSMLVHPYDDAASSPGRAPSRSKCWRRSADLDVLVIPIGGGGLIAGNAIAARAMKPKIEIVGVEAALYPSMWNALHAEQPCRSAGRRWPKASRSRMSASCTLPIDARTGRRHPAGRRGASRARGQRLSHACRRPWPKAPAPPGLAACSPIPIASAAKRSASFCAAAISTRAFLPPSWCANSSARPASSRSASPFRTGPACSAPSPRRLGAARRQYSRSRSPPAVPRRAGQGRQARRHHRDARRRARRRHPAPRSPPTAISRCASRPARRME